MKLQKQAVFEILKARRNFYCCILYFIISFFIQPKKHSKVAPGML